MPFGWLGFCGREFDRVGSGYERTVGRPHRDRRAVKTARRARRHNRRR